MREVARNKMRRVYQVHVEAKRTLLFDENEIESSFIVKGYADIEREKRQKENGKLEVIRAEEEAQEEDVHGLDYEEIEQNRWVL